MNGLKWDTRTRYPVSEHGCVYCSLLSLCVHQLSIIIGLLLERCNSGIQRIKYLKCLEFEDKAVDIESRAANYLADFDYFLCHHCH